MNTRVSGFREPAPPAFFWPGGIIPAPKRAVYGGRPVALAARGDGRPVCAVSLGRRAAAPELEAAAEWKRHLEALHAGVRVAVLREDETPPASVTLIVMLGTPASHGRLLTLCRRRRLRLGPAEPGREGYRIRFLEAGPPAFILCGGSDPAGCYFGVQSLKQLCTVRPGGIILRRATVDDYPTVPFRGMNLNSPRACACLAAAKLNGWVVNQYHLLHRWKTPPAPYRAYLRRVCREAPRHGAQVLQVVNPLRSPDGGYGGAFKIQCGSNRDIERLYRTLCLSLEAGSRMVMLAFDDHASKINGPASHYILTDPDDRRRFRGDLGRAHAHVAGRIYARLCRDYPGVTLLVCPVYYYLPRGPLHTLGEAYLRTLGRALPPEVGIVWTGNGVRSPDLRRVHLDRYRALIGRKPFFWNNDFNCLHAAPRYLFDPFGAGYFKGLPSSTGHGMMIDYCMEGRTTPGAVAWTAPVKQVMRVALWQVADYMWNPERHEAERSLRRALAAVAGPASVASLLRFRDACGELHDRFVFLRSPQTRVPLDADAVRRMRALLREARAALAEASRRGAPSPLINELNGEWLAPLVRNAGAGRVVRGAKADIPQQTEYGLYLPAPCFPGYAGSRYAGEAVTPVWSWPLPSYLRATRAVFTLAGRPRRAALLCLMGRRDGRFTGVAGDAVRLRLEINGRRVFEGATEFRPDPMLAFAWHVDRTVFRRGRNTLTIANVTPCHQLFYLAWAKLVGLEAGTRSRDDPGMVLQQ